MTRATSQGRQASFGRVCRDSRERVKGVGDEVCASQQNARRYQRHRPEQTLLYRIVEDNYPAFVAQMAREGRALPYYVQREFDEYLGCGRLEHGFLRVRCDDCRAERLVAFSCKRRGFCPSCGARRMAEAAALLVDEVFPEQPVRQWVLSFPYPLRFLFANKPEVMSHVLGIVYRVITTHLVRKAGFTRNSARTQAVSKRLAGGRLKSPRFCGAILLEPCRCHIDRGPGLRPRLASAGSSAPRSRYAASTASGCTPVPPG